MFTSTDYWKIPGGGRGIAVATVRDRALLFSTAGLYMLSNLALDLTDPSGNIQQRLEQVRHLQVPLRDGLAGGGGAGRELVEQEVIEVVNISLHADHVGTHRVRATPVWRPPRYR